MVKADNDSIVKKEDLKGKTLGVTIGSTGEEAARKIEGADVRVYNTLSDAFIDLKHGPWKGSSMIYRPMNIMWQKQMTIL